MWVPVLRLHQVRSLPGIEPECSLVKLRDRHSMLDEPKLAALRLTARVIGILLRQVFKLGARLQLLQHILSLRTRLGISLGIGTRPPS